MTRLAAFARYSLADQLALHAEYSRATTSFRAPATPDMHEDFFTVQFDVAFGGRRFPRSRTSRAPRRRPGRGPA